VWVTKHSGTEATVFSPICPHLGCGYNWNGDAQEFVCPCHGSKWDIGGRTLGGPTPRGLDTLPYKVEGGELYVEWQQFKAGIANKERI
jgi:menaquinol-cytochrome c reductase iron-sulfur subunit